MRSSDTCFSQSHVNSLPQIAPMHHNVLAQTSQINFLQQQQQQQQQQLSNNQQQPMQSQQYYCYPANQQGTYPQNQYVPPYQQDPYGVGQQQQPIPRTGLTNLGQPLGQTSYNVPSVMQPQTVGYGSLPPHILDQIRSYIGTPGPIFILPSNCPNPSIQPPPAATNTTTNLGCPGIGINCPSTGVHGYPAGSCYPYPVAMPMFNPFPNSPQPTTKDVKNCGCCGRKSAMNSRNSGIPNSSPYHFANETEEHRCVDTTDDTICTRKNCPSAINLQALVSQLLSIQGVISCAATRLILRKVPGSNITTTMEETMERAKRALSTLNKEQLLSETRGAQQVNALINLHMTANPPMNVIPILTTLQLKVNLLKAHVDSSINRRLSENQGIGVAEGAGNLDSVMLATRTDQELRDLLGTLRQKECDERVNLNFAPYQSQRVIAESRLTNVQNKIAQIEEEMDRRRVSILPGSSMGHKVAQQASDPGCGAWYGYTGDVNNLYAASAPPQNYDSPDPFYGLQARNPKRLNLKPHVGSPETTYKTTGKTSKGRASRDKKESDEEDFDDDEKHPNCPTNVETRCCNCDKSSEDESADEGKKKLAVKIQEPREYVSTRVDKEAIGKGGVSIVKLLPNVVIVIDETGSETRDKSRREDKGRREIVKEEIGDEVKREKSVDPEKKSLVETVRKDDEKNTSVPMEGTKKLKSAGKKAKVRDQTTEKTTVDRSSTQDNVNKMADSVNKMADNENKVVDNENKMADSVNKMADNVNKMADNEDKMEEEKYETPPLMELSPADKIDFNHENVGPESLREETVRMITKIHYEPTAFRGFNDKDTPGKEKIIEERYKGSFAENSSLNSTSTECTIDSNSTNESLSLRVENYEESLIDAGERGDRKKNLESLVKKEPRTINAETQAEPEKVDKNLEISVESKIDARKKNAETSSEKDAKDNLTTVPEDESRNDLISGALSTIGNHVASFGSIIGKIASLKLHRREEGSNDTIIESASKNVHPIEDSRVDDNEIVATGSQGNSRIKSARKENEKPQDIGRWRYIRFSDVEESTNTSNEDVNLTRENPTSYTLPRLKHSVIEDKRNGGKYVVVDKPSKLTSHQLGEPYKIGRSLVIRSRLKSPQSGEQSGPFTVVKGPKSKDKNCIALSLVNVRSLRKNSSKNGNELKSSEKFWLKPETRERKNDTVDSGAVHKSRARDSQGDKFKVIDRSANNDPGTVLDSSVTVTDEHVVRIHDYSRIRVNP